MVLAQGCPLHLPFYTLLPRPPRGGTQGLLRGFAGLPAPALGRDILLYREILYQYKKLPTAMRCLAMRFFSLGEMLNSVSSS